MEQETTTEKILLNTAKVLALVVLALYFTACAGGGGSDAGIADKIVDATPSDLIAPIVNSNDPVIATPSLTYYKISKTVAPVNGWITKTYTATGACVVYLTKTYCWDDGMKTLQWVSNNHTYGPYTYTYFGMQGSAASWGPCSGGCTSDLLPAPRVISATLENNIGSAVINNVFTNGVATNVTCTEQSGQLNCIDFVINLNQAPL